MKHTFLLLLFFSGMLFSSSEPTCKTGVGVHQTPPLVQYVGEKYALLFNPTDSVLYKLQFNVKPTIPAHAELVQFTPSELRRREQGTQRIVSYALNGQIIGIAKMKGPRYTGGLMTNNGTALAFVPGLDDGDVEELSCQCYQVAAVHSCQSGGAGSNGCEITDGGSVGGVGWTNHCQVSCTGGYYACCNE